jgi:DNA-binding MarR family transcriptional regulator
VKKAIHSGAGAARGARARERAALDEAIELLHRIFQSVDLFSRQALRDFGVTGPQIWALQTIAGAGMLSMGDLAQGMHLHVSTVTGIIDRLESAGLVTRERSAADARVMELRLTAKGKGILARSPEPPRSKVARRLQRLRPAELRKLRASLLLIAEAMGVDLSDPGDHS